MINWLLPPPFPWELLIAMNLSQEAGICIFSTCPGCSWPWPNCSQHPRPFPKQLYFPLWLLLLLHAKGSEWLAQGKTFNSELFADEIFCKIGNKWLWTIHLLWFPHSWPATAVCKVLMRAADSAKMRVSISGPRWARSNGSFGEWSLASRTQSMNLSLSHKRNVESVKKQNQCQWLFSAWASQPRLHG